MRKKLISLLLCAALILSIGVVAYAATGNFTMSYLPGTSDTVTNMPAADSGMGGQSYTVSSTVPQREGYEFLGWELDYGLSVDPVDPVGIITYSVRYISLLENKELGSKENIEIPEGETVEEYAEYFEGYSAIEPTYVSKTVMDGEVIYFYYLFDNIG